MIKENLLNFLRREYGEGYQSLLEDLLRRNNIESLEDENKSKLRTFARDIRDALPTISISKRNLLFSAIIRILKLDEKDSEIKKNENEKKEDDTEFIKIEKFVKNVEKTLIKYETIFNLFWLRAGEAEIEGINHDDILKTTQKALIGIRNDLEKQRDEILSEYNLLEKCIEKQKNNFYFKTGSLIEQKISEKNESELRKKKIIKEIFDFFWKDVENNYIEFKKVFIESMEKDIQLKKEGKDDIYLIKETKEKMIQLWSDLEKSYKKFEEMIKDTKEKLKKNN